MSDEENDSDLLDLIYSAANRQMDLNHKSAELHQSNVDRVIPAIAAMKDAAPGRSEAMLMSLLGKSDS